VSQLKQQKFAKIKDEKIIWRLKSGQPRLGCFILCRGNPPVVAPTKNETADCGWGGWHGGTTRVKIVISLRMKQPWGNHGGLPLHKLSSLSAET